MRTQLKKAFTSVQHLKTFYVKILNTISILHLQMIFWNTLYKIKHVVKQIWNTCTELKVVTMDHFSCNKSKPTPHIKQEF